jgi:hypothetical protein
MVTEVVTEFKIETHPNYDKFSHLLSDGWIPGRKVVRATLRILRSLVFNPFIGQFRCAICRVPPELPLLGRLNHPAPTTEKSV